MAAALLSKVVYISLRTYYAEKSHQCDAKIAYKIKRVELTFLLTSRTL